MSSSSPHSNSNHDRNSDNHHRNNKNGGSFRVALDASSGRATRVSLDDPSDDEHRHGGSGVRTPPRTGNAGAGRRQRGGSNGGGAGRQRQPPTETGARAALGGGQQRGGSSGNPTSNHHHNHHPGRANSIASNGSHGSNSAARLRRRSSRVPSERMVRKAARGLQSGRKRQEARRASRRAAERSWERLLALSQSQSASSSWLAGNDQQCNNGISNGGNGNHHRPVLADDLRSLGSASTATTDAQLLHEHRNHNSNNKNNNHHHNSVGSSSSTVASAERALWRGHRRGSRERNEALEAAPSNRNTAGRDASELDLTTIAEDTVWEEEPPRRRQRQDPATTHAATAVVRGRPSRAARLAARVARTVGSRSSRAADTETDANELQAWMCGVCGLAFGSEPACGRHEARHIATVVRDMGLWPPPPPPPSRGAAGVQETTGNKSHPTTPTKFRQQHQQQPQPNTNNHAWHLDGGVPLLASPSHETARTSNAVAAASPVPSPDSFQQTHYRFEEAKLPEDSSSIVDDDGYPGIDADLPRGALVPRPRARSGSSELARLPCGDPQLPGPPQRRPVERDANDRVFFSSSTSSQQQQRSNNNNNEEEEDSILLLPNDVKDYMVVADEALLDVVVRAQPLVLSPSELAAERELALLARDKAYYDELSRRAAARRFDPSNRFRTDDGKWLGQVQNKLLDAYQLMKEGGEGDGSRGGKQGRLVDQYTRKKKAGEAEAPTIAHDDRTLYVNVMVRNSVQVVRHELQRLAKRRWEAVPEEEQQQQQQQLQPHHSLNRFERFRVYTQINMVKLAGIALASDFTPRRIAVQLSNDTYRLLTPRLKRRGVTIETEIEYRVGPYFVLAVNINTIDWRKLIRATHRDVVQRKARWEKERQANGEQRSFFRKRLDSIKNLHELTVFDAIANMFSILYHFHWIVYLPVCWVAYNTFLGTSIRHFILSTVTDEIFFYVEEKGMEMEIRVCRSEKQAAFMLSALREIRADGEELKKKRQESESQEKGPVLGPLLGPAIAADKLPATIPDGFEVPPNLEFIGLELDLPVGFQRLRWALLSKRSDFVTEALYKTEAKYEDIVMGNWDKHDEHIGEPKLPEGVNPADFIGAQKEGEYLMPKSAFVSANMSYETHFLVAYNDYCFCLKKRSKNPDAPFGKSFVAWTQYVVVNTGNNTCRLTCSVEAEFPNGEPMVSRQIRSGMRAGTGELFVLTGETITKYADEFP